MEKFLNLKIMAQPLNWAIVFLMVAFGVVALDLIKRANAA